MRKWNSSKHSTERNKWGIGKRAHIHTQYKSNTSTCYNMLKLCYATQRQITRQLKCTQHTRTHPSRWTIYITYSVFQCSSSSFLNTNICSLYFFKHWCSYMHKLYTHILVLSMCTLHAGPISLSTNRVFYRRLFNIHPHTHNLNTKIQIHLNNHLNLIFCSKKEYNKKK